MQFTKLRLQGFKSFVDPTELVIAPGLTGVVGPNGCGKSNLLEALRWVMGEARARMMRGGEMEDVIFAGAANRPPRNQASVALVIDNHERKAPVAFNASDLLEVSRRITRNIGSAYMLNGKSVRARDVQMLFADAASGATSPALVRQGQISELIMAKPKARRRVLEEAAGISGLYQRRHEAELKLNAAEANLGRVDEVLQGLETQLKSLQRQAGQAKRYREIAAALRDAEAMLLWLRLREAEAALVEVRQSKSVALQEESAAERAVAEAERLRDQAAEAMPPLRDEEAIAGALLQRLTIERDQCEAEEARARAEIDRLAARSQQLEADHTREQTLSRDAVDTVARLEEEAERLTAEAAGDSEALHVASEAAAAAANALADAERAFDELNERAAQLSMRTQSLDRRRVDAEAAAARLSREIEQGEAAAAGLRAHADGQAASLGQAKAQAGATERALTAAEAGFTAAEAAAAEAVAAARTAQASAAERKGRLTALQAELDGVTALLSRERPERGRLIDAVEVAPGFEAALAAAFGDTLAMPEAEGGEHSGWRELSPLNQAPPLPEGTAPLADQVTTPAALGRGVSQTGLVDPAEAARLQEALQPGQQLVSTAGDLWRWDGYVVHAGDARSDAATHLERQNKARALGGEVAEIVADLDRLSSEAGDAETAAEAARQAEATARTARREAEAAASAAARALTEAEAEVTRSQGRLEVLEAALAERRDEAEAAAETLSAIALEAEGLDDPAAAREAADRQRVDVDAARDATMATRNALSDVQRDIQARADRSAEIARELARWQARQGAAAERIGDLDRRIDATAQELQTASGLPAEIAARRDRIAKDLSQAETRKREAADRLADGETRLRQADDAVRQAERTAADRREGRVRLDAVEEAAAAKVAESELRIREDLEVEPEALTARLGDIEEPLPTLDKAEAEVVKLRRQRDALGAVNLRADEDARAVAAEHESLAAEKEDLEAAIAKLRSGINALNAEGRQRIREAFDDVNTRFAKLFRHLFGGGEARLVMVESDDPLEAGLEILCQPPGKKLSTLSLLSGGEQTLTALSLIFAIFLCNPSPVCVLDEVDAPLDDSNVVRFCDLLDEMVRLTDTRFLIITHHAVTMARMDRLYGVTMVEAGVSQLVSVDLRAAEQLVDA